MRVLERRVYARHIFAPGPPLRGILARVVKHSWELGERPIAYMSTTVPGSSALNHHTERRYPILAFRVLDCLIANLWRKCVIRRVTTVPVWLFYFFRVARISMSKQEFWRSRNFLLQVSICSNRFSFTIQGGQKASCADSKFET